MRDGRIARREKCAAELTARLVRVGKRVGRELERVTHDVGARREVEHALRVLRVAAQYLPLPAGYSQPSPELTER